MSSRRRLTCSSVRSRTRVSGLTLVWTRIFWAVGSPMPKMYVRATSIRFSRGMSSPAIRAISLPLPLLVLRVGADDHHGAVTADHFAVVAAGLDGGSAFQRFLVVSRPSSGDGVTSAGR